MICLYSGLSVCDLGLDVCDVDRILMVSDVDVCGVGLYVCDSGFDVCGLGSDLDGVGLDFASRGCVLVILDWSPVVLDRILMIVVLGFDIGLDACCFPGLDVCDFG